MDYCIFHFLKLLTRKNKTYNRIDKYCPGCKSIPKNTFIDKNLDEKLAISPLIMSSNIKYLIDNKLPLKQSDYDYLEDSKTSRSLLRNIAIKLGITSFTYLKTKKLIINSIKKKLGYNNVDEPVEIPIKQINVNKIDDVNNLKVNNDELNKNNSNLDEKNNIKYEKISNENMNS